jgi:threonine aldolase
MRRQFASDNYAGICPEAWDALAQANGGHAPAYGEDEYTQRAADLIREYFETDCEVFFVFNGTAANSLALSSLCQSYHSVLCHELAHIETDECGAPEFFSNGSKILVLPGDSGKVDLEAVESAISRRSDIHYPKPKVLSLTQPTEVGTVYTVSEVENASTLAHRHGLRVHMDGARLPNALVTLSVAPKRLTWQAGVDVLCLGGTKMGMPAGEAVVFFNRSLAAEFDYRCKQSGQLAAKMRFLAAPWIGLLRGGGAPLLAHARHANACAERLDRALRGLPDLTRMFPREANALFVDMPRPVVDALRERGWRFYTFIGDGGARFMCSWDTQDADVDALSADIRELAEALVD